MVILEDTRQQTGRHEEKRTRWREWNDDVIRSKLVVGDYALPPAVSVDTKAGLEEIAQNIGGSDEEHARFRRELKLARACGCVLYVLIENEDGVEKLEDVRTWINPRLNVSPKAITGERLEKAMKTMADRYGVRWAFCRPDEAAGVIKDILTRGADYGER